MSTVGLGKNKPTIGEVLDQTMDRARETAEHYVEVARPHVEAALDSTKQFVADTAVPAINDARDKAAPVIAAGAAEVATKAGQAKEYAATKAAEVGPTKAPKKRSKVKVLLLAAGAAGAVAVVAKKLQGSSQDDGWQSSYTPTPPPAPAAEPTDSTLTDVSAGGPDEVVDEPLGAVDEPLPADTPDPLTDPLPEHNR